MTIRFMNRSWYRFFMLYMSFGSSFKFHPNLFFKRNKIKFLPSFYREIFLHWKKYRTIKSELPSCILSYYLWYNENIQVDNNSIFLVRRLEKKVNYVSQLFRADGSIKTWYEFKTEYKLHEKLYFQWLQLISAVPER